MIIDVQQVRALAEGILIGCGAPPAHAEVQVDLLLDAQMRGVASHGLMRLPRIVQRVAGGLADPCAQGLHTWRRKSFLEVDGQGGLGPVVAMHALKALAPRAAENGIAVAAIRNNNHLGMLAWYAEQIARQQLAVIVFTTSEALVHPWGGRKAMVGTNPVAIGVPAQPEPLVLDMATSLVSMGKVHDYASRGVPLQPGWALDACGEPTTDARAATQGALAPFGGPKGYALGVAIELLVTCLAGSQTGTRIRGTLDATEICNKGDVFIVISPQGGVAVAALMNDYLCELRSCTPSQLGQPVVIPGDRARRSRRIAMERGLDIDDRLWNQLKALNKSPGISASFQESSL